jgi:signal transduction histidine kinase
MHVDDLRSLSIFDGLTNDQLADLITGGTEVRIEPGVDLFREGEYADFWWVLIDGAIDLIRRVGREDSVVARMDVPGRWAGGFRAWDEHGTYLATGRGATEGRVLRVPAGVLRDRADAWFPFGAHLIAGLYRTARSIESTARQRSSLVTLGTLAAGIAHEINNPAAAASRAVDGLEMEFRSLQGSVRQLVHKNISPEQFAELDALGREIAPAELDPLARADREQALVTWLNRNHVARAWIIAPQLAADGVDLDWCARIAAVLEGSALEPGLEWVASTFSVATLLAEMREATQRISELVAAVRSYTQMDRASMQHIDVTDGLDSTLVMLGHKLRGVTVVREYGTDVPMIDAYAGELNQVWTNLIDNAVDAMGGSGTLHIATRVEDGEVVIEIRDTGSGMSPEVAARAFEAFYTTKDVGHGTGLGLDIARRIIAERHGGSISIDSRPGQTTLRVELPVRRSEPRSSC